MSSKKTTGMKSAYELAMERLEQREGKRDPLSGEQKEAIAEAEREYKARLAELEISYTSRLAEARGSGEEKRLAELEEELSREKRRASDRLETERARIRGK